MKTDTKQVNIYGTTKQSVLFVSNFNAEIFVKIYGNPLKQRNTTFCDPKFAKKKIFFYYLCSLIFVCRG